MGEMTVRQVGAASRALSGEPLLCASLKSNMGHLEAAAAAAGLAALVTGPLLTAIVAVNAQLRGSAGLASWPSFAASRRARCAG